jgi:hypothetical protein
MRDHPNSNLPPPHLLEALRPRPFQRFVATRMTPKERAALILQLQAEFLGIPKGTGAPPPVWTRCARANQVPAHPQRTSSDRAARPASARHGRSVTQAPAACGLRSGQQYGVWTPSPASLLPAVSDSRSIVHAAALAEPRSRPASAEPPMRPGACSSGAAGASCLDRAGPDDESADSDPYFRKRATTLSWAWREQRPRGPAMRKRLRHGQ